MHRLQRNGLSPVPDDQADDAGAARRSTARRGRRARLRGDRLRSHRRRRAARLVHPRRARRGPAVVFVHGWLWNRLGNVEGQVPVADKRVDFLPAAKALHDAGYHVLLFDLRSHGEARRQAADHLRPARVPRRPGGVDYLRAREEVDSERIGALGCSMGANTAIYGAADAPPVKAILAVQATRVTRFNHNFHGRVRAVGPSLLKPVGPLYKLLGRRAEQAGPGGPGGASSRTRSSSTCRRPATRGATCATPRTSSPRRRQRRAGRRYAATGRYEGYRYVTSARRGSRVLRRIPDVASFQPELRTIFIRRRPRAAARRTAARPGTRRRSRS